MNCKIMTAYIHELFQLCVMQNFHQTVVVLDYERLTYRELNRQANQLAHYLCKLGVGPEVVVGVCLERSPAKIVALLGILKAGGAYLPLDPTYPKERLAFMIQDARASVVLTRTQHLKKLPQFNAESACLDADEEIIVRESQENLVNRVQAQNLASIGDLAASKAIATSGIVLPIERAMENSQKYILDPLLKPVPEGEMRELCIGGISLTQGYLNLLQQSKIREVEFFRTTRPLKTPFIIYNLEELDKSYQTIQQALPSVKIYYSVKCNPHERIIERLKNQGSGFEIASLAEAEQLFKQNVNPSEIICLHPIKSPDFIQYLHHHQLDILAVDSYEEVDKIAALAPGSKIVVRVTIPNTKSVWSLSGKFGIDASETIALFKYIQAKGLIPYGITTHVGSQCEDLDSWLECVRVYQNLLTMAQIADIKLQFVSLGGGLPVRYCQPVPETEAIGKVIRENLLAYTCSDNYQVSIEPGRAMVATTGILVVTVIGLAKRGEQMWAYIDAGSYNGLAEAIETSDRQFYQIITEHPHRRQVTYNIGGPTCASMDAPFQDISLPELQVGDRLYILDVGAYSISCASSFNGFPVPDTYFYRDLR
jgi:ornithine decarboxylase